MSGPFKLLRRKQTDYRLALGDESGKVVLADLRTFCNPTRTNFSTDPLEMARMEGRREVFLRIANFMNVDFDEYYNYEEDYDYD